MVREIEVSVVDEASAQSFPASDPPAWATGQRHPRVIERPDVVVDTAVTSQEEGVERRLPFPPSPPDLGIEEGGVND